MKYNKKIWKKTSKKEERILNIKARKNLDKATRLLNEIIGELK